MKALKLDHLQIAEQWATLKGQSCNSKLYDEYENKITQAASCCFLKAVLEPFIPEKEIDKHFYPKPYHLHYIIQRDDLLVWLQRTQQWPLPASCLLAEWFEYEPSKIRQSQLHILIWRVHQFLNVDKRPTAQEVWHEMQHRSEIHDTDKIIQEINGINISWSSGYGNEPDLKRTTFNSTLSKLRRKPPILPVITKKVLPNKADTV